MEVVLQARENAHQKSNQRKFYLIKGIFILLTTSFLLSTILIFAHDHSYYQLCDEAAARCRASMILLIIYHFFELLNLIYDVAAYKRKGLLKAICKANQCYGIFVYLYLQLFYFQMETRICFTTHFQHLKTANWIAAEIVYFYAVFIGICAIACFVGCNTHKNRPYDRS